MYSCGSFGFGLNKLNIVLLLSSKENGAKGED
jgi:hypothetical protein